MRLFGFAARSRHGSKRIPVCGFEFDDVELKVKNGLTQRALSPNFLLRQLPSPEAGLLVAVFVEPLPEPLVRCLHPRRCHL